MSDTSINVTELTNKNATLEKELQNLKNNYQQLVNAYNAKNIEVEAVKDQLAETVQSTLNLRTNNKILNNNIQSVQNALETANKTIKELNAKLDTVQSKDVKPDQAA